MPRLLPFLLLPAVFAPAVAAPADLNFRSGPASVALIELFTSEGCSSCPPAEKWLAGLRSHAGLWTDFVPVAFHVNYWDHLGWRDVLATKAFTEREHAYAAAWRAPSVYTPCFVRNGAEWRPRDAGWVASRSATDAGRLSVRWMAETNSCEIAYEPRPNADADGGFEVSAALLGGGIVTSVRQGENAGRELRHEFVALRLAKSALKSNGSGQWSAIVSLPPRAEIATPRRALAAWVTRRGQLVPLQAAGGWLE